MQRDGLDHENADGETHTDCCQSERGRLDSAPRCEHANEKEAQREDDHAHLPGLARGVGVFRNQNRIHKVMDSVSQTNDYFYSQ